MANLDRGEMQLRCGGQTRVLRFRAPEVALLEEKLDCEPLAFLGQQKGQMRFLIAAIWAGLSRTEKTGKHTPGTVAIWLDDDKDPIDRDAACKDILYAIARGKPEAEAKEMVRQLDIAFNDVAPSVAAEGKGPLAEGSPQPTSATSY